MTKVYNKVVYNGSTLVDLTSDTVQASHIYKGDTAHGADGSAITGTAEVTVDDKKMIMPEGLITPISTVDPVTNHWIRPEGLPDLDSVYDGEENTLYMTIDATGRISDPHISIKFSTTGSSVSYTVQVGSIQNGSFVADTTETKAHNAIYTKVFTPADNYYPVVKVTSTHLRDIIWQAWTSDNGNAYVAQYQPVIEWIGHCEHLTSSVRTPYFTEREKIDVNTCNASFLQNRWNSAFNLQELDVSDWDTSNWAIGYLTGTWYQCFNLKSLDVSNWDTSNWAVTSLGTTWSYCLYITELDLSAWDTSNWVVTSLASTWDTCYRLRSLKIGTWDTSNWAVTNINATWNNCNLLEELDTANWDTSNWHVIYNMANTWAYCRQLKHLDLNHWDTSNWEVGTAATGTMQYTWYQCHKLIDLNVSNWDTSKWVIKNIGCTWQYCYSLERLNVNSWDTSKWNITNMSNTWDTCTNLKSLDLSNWDTSNWEVTTLTATWIQCRVLKSLNVSTWDTSKWKVTTIANMFNSCLELEEFPLSTWDTSNWPLENLYYAFTFCSRFKEIDMSGWDATKWVLIDNSFYGAFRYCYSLESIDLSWIDLTKIKNYKYGSTYVFDNCKMLQHVYFGSDNNGKMNTTTTYPLIRFDHSTLLTRESILNIFNALADGVSEKTLQLGTVNLNKMTAAEKAIATNKGWTLT